MEPLTVAEIHISYDGVLDITQENNDCRHTVTHVESPVRASARPCQINKGSVNFNWQAGLADARIYYYLDFGPRRSGRTRERTSIEK